VKKGGRDRKRRGRAKKWRKEVKNGKNKQGTKWNFQIHMSF
jgi:hypothetical protein